MAKLIVLFCQCLCGTLVFAGDLVTVRLVSSSASVQTGLPVTFGQVFIQGDVPAGKTVGARSASGEIPLQVDIKDVYGDGSLKHAILSLIHPSLPGNATDTLILFLKNTLLPGSELKPADLLATTYDVLLSVNLRDTITRAETLYTVSAKTILQNIPGVTLWSEGSAAIKAAFASGRAVAWLQGPIVTEWLICAPVKNAAGRGHPHLQAYFHVRAYAGMTKVRANVILENNWAYEPGPQNWFYDVVIKRGADTCYARKNVTHYHHARWRKEVWWPQAPSLNIKPDPKYLMATKAIPNFDTSVTASQTTLAGYQTILASGSPDYDIMGPASTSMKAMGSAGQFPDYGILPAWTSLYFISDADPRAWSMSVANSDAMGALHVHLRDKPTGLPVSIAEHRGIARGELVTQSEFGDAMPWPAGKITPYQFDVKKHPAHSFVPYLLTGDYFHLEELQFLANYCAVWRRPVYRQYERGIINGEEPRHIAYGCRTLGQAAAFTPDAHPFKSYFMQIIINNIHYQDSQHVSNPGYYKNYLGWSGPVMVEAPNPVMLSGWMQDLGTIFFGYLHDLGIPGVLPFVKFKSKFSTGKWTHEAEGVCKNAMGTTYLFLIGDTGTGPWYSTWREVYQKSHAWDSTVFPTVCPTAPWGTPEAADSYFGIARAANAIAAGADVMEPGAMETFRYIKNYQDSMNRLDPRYPPLGTFPQWIILPRDSGSLIAVEKMAGKTPSASLEAFPNPFNPSITIRMNGVPNGAQPGDLTLAIYDVRGRLVHSIILQGMRKSYVWNALSMASGIYSLKLFDENGRYSADKRISLTK